MRFNFTVTFYAIDAAAARDQAIGRLTEFVAPTSSGPLQLTWSGASPSAVGNLIMIVGLYDWIVARVELEIDRQ